VAILLWELPDAGGERKEPAVGERVHGASHVGREFESRDPAVGIVGAPEHQIRVAQLAYQRADGVGSKVQLRGGLRDRDVRPAPQQPDQFELRTGQSLELDRPSRSPAHQSTDRGEGREQRLTQRVFFVRGGGRAHRRRTIALSQRYLIQTSPIPTVRLAGQAEADVVDGHLDLLTRENDPQKKISENRSSSEPDRPISAAPDTRGRASVPLHPSPCHPAPGSAPIG
jgi:hypothetical protein